MGKNISDPRQRLLDASLKLFADRGYAGTSVQDIAEEAKVTKPTLYYYFGNKEGLFQALVDQAMDERLHLMQEAATPEKETVDQLTDIIVAVTNFARRQPDLLRLCFSISFAAPGEIPSGFKKHHKMGESYHFVHEIMKTGLERGVLNTSFNVDELTQAYFHLIQHSTVLSIFESKLQKTPTCLPPRMEPRRLVELFLGGAADRAPFMASEALPKRAPRLAKAAMIATAFGLTLLGAQGQGPSVPPGSALSTNEPSMMTMTTNAVPVAPLSETNAPAVIVPPPSTNVVPMLTSTAPGANASPISTLTTTTNAPVAVPFSTNALGTTTTQDTNAVPTMPLPATNAPTNLADVRPVPPAVLESHPELATVSPIKQNANDPHALDLQTCFQLTAIRDDSLKISLHDIYVAQAQLSQSLSALWPTFAVTNQQEFSHYNRTSVRTFTIPFIGGSISTGTDRNYNSASHVTMSYTVFNGLQNWNGLNASDAAIAAKKETLARDYQTIYQSVAQAFYNVLQFEGDMVIQADLIDALKARVTDLGDRVKLGRSRPSELLQAQTDLANAKVTYEAQRGSLNAAKETLAFYIGIPAGYFKLKESQKFPTAHQLEYYVMQSGARPDILAQLQSLRQAERLADVAIGQMFPTITAQGDYLASQDPNTNPVDATMIIEASMPIFDGGLILGQIHENKELVRQSRLDVEQLKRTADEDTRTAYANFNSSASQVVVLREAAVLAAKNLEAQVNDYRKGVVSNLDVLTALEDYQSARQGLHNANMQARLDLINLHVAAGMAARGPNANNQALPSTVKTAP